MDPAPLTLKRIYKMRRDFYKKHRRAPSLFYCSVDGWFQLVHALDFSRPSVRVAVEHTPDDLGRAEWKVFGMDVIRVNDPDYPPEVRV